MNSEIRNCTCQHHQQDVLHGQGQRVMNPFTGKDGGKQRFRCTVCGAEY